MITYIIRAVRGKLKLLIKYDSAWLCDTDLTWPLPPVEPRLEVEFRVATPEDAQKFTNQEGKPISEQEKEKTLRRMSIGDLCIVGIHRGQFVGYSWTAIRRDKHLIDGKPINFGTGWCYGYNAYVVRPFRGKGIIQALIAFKYHQLRQFGFERQVSIIDSSNKIQRYLHEKRGDVDVGQFRRIILLHRWRFVWKSRALRAYLETVTRPTPGYRGARSQGLGHDLGQPIGFSQRR